MVLSLRSVCVKRIFFPMDKSKSNWAIAINLNIKMLFILKKAPINFMRNCI